MGGLKVTIDDILEWGLFSIFSSFIAIKIGRLMFIKPCAKLMLSEAVRPYQKGAKITYLA
ncbi:hypothetical protein JCM19235_5060 [Vibrio maritimus]|uniref:Uncharacterized protein n=1 Tax=Vibrio maritimus TaxID=990268 RepID=A0A090RMS7_9VIBR|nr:hypothetical protein JCM19235_5060 [Vibrio maritimus]